MAPLGGQHLRLVEQLRRLPTRVTVRQAADAATAFVARSPATFVYLFVIGVTTWTLRGAPPRLVDQLLLAQSTNVHNMLRDPLQVLVASAFWLDSPHVDLQLVLRFVVVMAPTERWLGTWRTVLVFAAGHVGATLVTFVGLHYGITHHLVDRSVSRVTDVGVSYGFFAVAAITTLRLPSRWRVLYALGLIGYVAAGLWVNRTFTDWGHVCALAIGFGCAPLARSRPVRPFTEAMHTRPEPAPAAVV